LRTSVFGYEGIQQGTREDLDLLLSLEDRKLERFVDWFSKSTRLFPVNWSEIDDLVDGTSLDPQSANRVLAVLRFLLINWKAYELSLDEISTDLESAGYKPEQIRKAVNFLKTVEGIRDRVYVTSLRRSYEVYGPPTIDDVNLMWDVRPVFQAPIYDTDPDAKGYDKLVSHTNVLILEIVSSAEKGIQKSSVFQLSEDDFARLSDAFDKAKNQLEIVKKRFA
jgi:hypothetical protein